MVREARQQRSGAVHNATLYTSPTPLPAATITASDVAAAIGRIGPAYVLYQQAFIDNGIDGTMLAEWRGQSEEDTLRTLTTGLAITSSLHGKRVLLELKKLWNRPPA
jgi:hypothetical protein